MAVELPVGVVFLEAQRYEVLVRAEAQEDGTWHNALVFRRDGRTSGWEPFVTGVDWHLSPTEALERALLLSESELDELLRRAVGRRTPLF